jgi:hypothetical protein
MAGRGGSADVFPIVFPYNTTCISYGIVTRSNTSTVQYSVLRNELRTVLRSPYCTVGLAYWIGTVPYQVDFIWQARTEIPDSVRRYCTVRYNTGKAATLPSLQLFSHQAWYEEDQNGCRPPVHIQRPSSSACHFSHHTGRRIASRRKRGGHSLVFRIASLPSSLRIITVETRRRRCCKKNPPFYPWRPNRTVQYSTVQYCTGKLTVRCMSGGPPYVPPHMTWGWRITQ